MTEENTPENTAPNRGMPLWIQITVWTVLVALLVVVFMGLIRAREGNVQAGAETESFDFTMPLFEGYYYKDAQEVSLTDLRGKIVVLNFWATWCAPCKEEMPSLDNLQANSNLNNIMIFPINIGQEELIKSQIFFDELSIKNLEIYFDPTVSLAKKFKLRGVPTSILFNKEGQEFARIIGSIDFNNKDFINWLKFYN